MSTEDFEDQTWTEHWTTQHVPLNTNDTNKKKVEPRESVMKDTRKRPELPMTSLWTQVKPENPD